MSNLDVCEVEGCPSRRFRLREDAYYYCSNGHQQTSAGPAEGEDEDNFRQQGRVQKAKRERAGRTERAVLAGSAAFELYILCYQLILRKQVWFLVHSKGFPADLKKMAHTLWTLRLRKLSPKLSSDADSESQSQLYSSQSEGEGTSASETSTPRRKARQDPSTSNMPRLIDTLALLYLSMLVLRIPPSLADLLRWVNGGEMPYYRALRLLPRDMRDDLPIAFARALDPPALLSPDALRKAVLRLVAAYSRDFGLAVPGVNAPLLLFRYVRELALPLDVYPTAQKLAGMLSYAFYFPDTKAERRRTRVTDSPEVQLMSCVIVAVKLLFPFSETDRGRGAVQSDGKTGLARMDWDAWDKAQRDYEAGLQNPGRLGFEDAMRVTEEEVLNMTDAQMDDYLDWYEDIWAEQDAATAQAQAQPANSSDEAGKRGAHARKLEAVQSAMRPRQQAAEPRKERNYRLYRTTEELAQDARANRFYAVAAEVAGLSLETLVKGVYLTEAKLFQYVRDERRRRAEGGSDEE